jgi:nitrate reductase delta subunit
VVAFWTDLDTRHQFKIFKRVEEVLDDDLPPRWMKNALIANEETFSCGC